jgi:hypothetical protein
MPLHYRCIIMEYAPDGDLSKVIKKWQMLRRPMPEDLIWKYFIQVGTWVRLSGYRVCVRS